jgi:diguanylate cyclase (GGDEF)-like protein
MPVVPSEFINDWHRHKKYPQSEVLTQEQIDEILLSYILFAQNLTASKIDPLTGCLKVIAFHDDFAGMIKEAGEKYEDVTLVMTDIDNFKHVNDEFGHKTGDDVLREIAEALLGIPTEHKTYRYSGDCFALLFPNCEKEQVFLVMEEARKKILGYTECLRTVVTISAGIATYPEDGNNDIDTIRKAEGALYRAKTSGRNKVSLAKEEKLVTKTAHYTVEQLKRLEKLAEERKISEASLMREALDELLKKYNK